MASTRNNNSSGNYSLEQYSLQKGRDFLTYEPASVASKTMFPGNGLLSGRYANTLLAQNSADIESYLYGIGSTDLVKPREQIVAKINKLDQISLFPTQPFILPKTWIPEKDQRRRFY
jgi:hypothetical protein